MAIKRRGGRDVRLSLSDRLSYAVARLAASLRFLDWRRYVLVAVPVSGMPLMMRGWEARILDEAAPAAVVDPETAEFRLRQGMLCIAAAREGAEAVGVIWVTTAAFDEDEAHLTFAPPPGAAWDTGLFIIPEARAGRAFAALWAGVRGWAETKGVHWSFSRIADYNRASRAAHARMGAIEVGRVAVLRFGSMQLALGASPAITRLDGRRANVRPDLPC